MPDPVELRDGRPARSITSRATGLLEAFGERSFDVVLVRHVLEHLPDFEASLSQALGVARRLAVFVFLTPRTLPFGVRKVNFRVQPGRSFNVYSRPALDDLLFRRGLPFAWHLGVGPSRAGPDAGEPNSVLAVSTG